VVPLKPFCTFVLLAVFCTCAARSPARADASPQPSPSPSPPADESDSNDGSPDFNAPLSPRLWFSLEDELTATYDDIGGSSNTLNVRAQVPLGKIGKQLPSPLLVPGRLQLVRIKVPFVTSAPANAVRGNGDTTLTLLRYLGVSDRKWVYGPTFKIPTASTNDLGTGRWSGGPAAAYIYTRSRTVLALYFETFVSFAGPKSRGAVSQTKIQPGVLFALPHGWGIGTSQMEFTYNWQNNTWQNVPLGVRIENTSQNSHHQLNVGVEFEKNLAHVITTAQWTFRLNFKYRLLQQH
jgi:hypothetical protein